jgi:predicted  nucleic acid-binding Zn-ribbon protein
MNEEQDGTYRLRCTTCGTLYYDRGRTKGQVCPSCGIPLRRCPASYRHNRGPVDLTRPPTPIELLLAHKSRTTVRAARKRAKAVSSCESAPDDGSGAPEQESHSETKPAVA